MSTWTLFLVVMYVHDTMDDKVDNVIYRTYPIPILFILRPNSQTFLVELCTLHAQIYNRVNLSSFGLNWIE